MLLCFPLYTSGALSAAPTAATTTEATAPGSHAGRTAIAAGAGARSVVRAGTASEGISIAPTAARKIPASYTIRSAPARPAAAPCSNAAYPASSGAIARQIATLST